MSALIRAMYVATSAAKVQEDSLNGLVDRKEKQLDKSKKINLALSKLVDARDADAGTTGANFSADERAAVLAAASDAGVSLQSELKEFIAPQCIDRGRASLTAGDSDDEDVKATMEKRNKALDRAEKKVERALQENQDATGMLDFKMNLSMNDLSKAMQDAQGVQQIRTTLNNALISRA